MTSTNQVLALIQARARMRAAQAGELDVAPEAPATAAGAHQAAPRWVDEDAVREGARAEWGSNREIREEFADVQEHFEAFRVAEAKGLVKQTKTLAEKAGAARAARKAGL